MVPQYSCLHHFPKYIFCYNHKLFSSFKYSKIVIILILIDMSSAPMNDSDDDFTFIDENENSIHQESEQEKQSGAKTNKDGKQVRGKYIEWRQSQIFNNVEDYKQSEIFNEMKDDFTEKRNNDWDYGHVYNYVCKFNHRAGYLPCFKRN